MFPFRQAIDAAKLLITAAVPTLLDFAADQRGMLGLPAQFGIDSASPGSGGPPSIIKRIQKITVQMAQGVTSNTGTITSVTTGNCAVFCQGYLSSQSVSLIPNSTFCDVVLTNSTTVTISRGASNTDGNTVQITVVEYTSAAVNSSAQSGTINLASATSATATISAVGANAFVICLGVVVSNGTSVNYGVGAIGVQLTNSTTVTAFAGTNSSKNGTVRFMVVDLASRAVSSVTQITVSPLNATDGLGFTTFADVDTTRTMTLFNGQKVNSATATANDSIFQAQLVSAGAVQCNRQGSSSLTNVVYITLIQWNPGVLKRSIQRGAITLTAQTNNTASITSVTTSLSFCNAAGWSSTGNVGTTGYLTTRLTSSAVVQVDANATATAVGSYEVIEYV